MLLTLTDRLATRSIRPRRDVAYADKALRPGAEIWATDFCVPIARLAECIAETEKDIAASFLPAPIVGHVGDGNFHVVIVSDRNSEWRGGGLFEELSDINQPALRRERDRLRSTDRVQLLQNNLHVVFHRVLTDVKDLADFFIALAESHLFQNLEFALG